MTPAESMRAPAAVTDGDQAPLETLLRLAMIMGVLVMAFCLLPEENIPVARGGKQARLKLGGAGEQVAEQRSTQATSSIAKTTAEDVRTTTALEAQYILDPRLSGLAIDVSTFDGVVTLSGHVDSGFDLARAIDIAMAHDSVHEVISRLRVVRSMADARQPPAWH
jgi:hypothetical protein